MGGTAPDRAELSPVEPHPRRLGRAQLVVGVPALALVAVGLFVAWQMKGGLGAAVLAGFLAPVVVVFGLYYAVAWRRLRSRPPCQRPSTNDK